MSTTRSRTRDPDTEPAGNPRDPRFDPLPPRRDRRMAIVLLSGLNIVAGAWLIIAPYALGYGPQDQVWSDVLLGAVVGLLGLIRATGAFRASPLSWANAVAGAWVFASAFWLDRSATAAANDLIMGAIVTGLAVGSAVASDRAAAGPRVR
jgi:hypothetical protein